MTYNSKYKDIAIPENLTTVVNDAVEEGLDIYRYNNAAKILKRTLIFIAVVSLSFILLLNIFPLLAAAAYEIPVIGNVCRIVTFREYHLEDEMKYIDARIPNIEGLGGTELETRLNLEIRKIISEELAVSEVRAKEYYDAFVETGGNPDEFIPLLITVDYEIKCVNKNYVSFIISKYETHASSYCQQYFYNINVDTGRIITLRDWFGNDYKKIISKSIEKTISEWDTEKKQQLWDDLEIENFLTDNTGFYINEDMQVVVAFAKYEIAAGSAGILEFTIDTTI